MIQTVGCVTLLLWSVVCFIYVVHGIDEDEIMEEARDND